VSSHLALNISVPTLLCKSSPDIDIWANPLLVLLVGTVYVAVYIDAAVVGVTESDVQVVWL